VTTAPFQLHGTHWRVVYSCTPNKSSGFASASILQADGGSQTIGLGGFDDCPLNHTYDFPNQTAGQFFLSVIASDASYTITVQDYY